MKKQMMKWLVATLAVAALATPAFAVTADISGNLWVRAISANNFDGNDNANDHVNGFDQRLRLFTTAAANENVKMVLGLEVDNVWGDTGAKYVDPTAATYTTKADKEIGKMGTDAKGQIEIKHLYLDAKLPSIKANLKAGSQGFLLGRGMIINDDAAGINFSMDCPAVPGNTLSLMYIKTQEGTGRKVQDDADFLAAKYDLKAGDLKVAPYLGYYTSGNQVTGAMDLTSTYLGVDLDGKAGEIGYAVTAIYNTWDNKGANTDGSSIALYAKANTKVGDTGVSLEAGRLGDKDNAGSFRSLAQGAATGPIVNISEIMTGGRFTSNSSLTANTGGAANLYKSNWLFLKLGAEQKLSDVSKVSAYIAHIAQAEDTAAGAAGKAKTYGQEIDLYYDYTIVPGLDLNLAAAYLFADKDFGNDDAQKFAAQLAYKF